LFIVIKMTAMSTKRIISQERCLAVLRYSRGEDDHKFHVKIGDNGIIIVSRKKHASAPEHDETNPVSRRVVDTEHSEAEHIANKRASNNSIVKQLIDTLESDDQFEVPNPPIPEPASAVKELEPDHNTSSSLLRPNHRILVPKKRYSIIS
jgi:hypothetical protein